MIVISRNLVLSPAADNPLNHPIIGWHNLVKTGNIAADGAASGFPVTNLANPVTYLYWRGADTSDQYVTITTNEVDEIDYVAVAGHNFGTGLIVVSVEGREADDGEWSELVEEKLLADDTPLILRFEPQSLYQVRLKLQPDAVAPQAAVVYAGKLLVMERGLVLDDPHTPFPFGRKTEVINGKAEGGAFLGRVILNEFTESVANFSHLTPDWYRETFEPFARVSQEKPFFFAWKPLAYPDEVGFAWLADDVTPEVDHATGRMRVELKMSGIVA